MTEPVPPILLSYEPPPRTPRWRWGALVAWVVILVSVVSLVVRPRWLARAARGGTTPALPSVSETPSPQLELVARYVVGARALAGSQAPPAASLLPQVDHAATNAIDEFRAIAVVGELLGGEAARERLNAFEKKYQVVRLRKDVALFRRIYTVGPNGLTADEQRMLVERHHWFGQLAVAYGLPTDDPRRVAAMGPARRSVFVLGGGFFLAMGALVCGIALAILAIMFMRQRRIVAAYRPVAPWVGGRFVEAFALYLAGMVLLSLALVRLFPGAGLGATFVLFALLPLAMVYLRVRGVAWGEILRGLGWHRGRGVLREIGAGLYGYIAGLPLLAVGVAVTFVLMKVTGNTATHPIVNEPVDRAGEVLQLVLLACVGAPIVEETMFRGALLGHLRTRLGWWVSAPVVSLIFAAIHPQGWVAIPTLAAIAMVLAALREVRGSIIASMTAHALNNGVAVTIMVLLMK